MPRPRTKRNRLTSKPSDSAKQAPNQDSSRNDTESRDISRSPTSVIAGSSRLAHNADPSEIVRQLRNQTPLSKAQEFAIGSSPAAEHGATGSRPPTRARGYSSTLSIAGRKGDMSSRIPGTPAFESSILSNFRRRPRQASILHMMQDEDGSSDFDDEDFLGGLSPEDESTPLNISRGKSLVLPQVASPSPIKSTLPSSGKSSKRKRSVEELEAPQSPLDVVSTTPGSPVFDAEDRERDVTAVPQSPLGSLASLNETMVPPMSSPPGLSHAPSTPDTIQPSSSKKGPVNNPVQSATENEIYISTATLQGRFLPRRRRRRVVHLDSNNFEVLSDSDEDGLQSAAPDEDELSYLPSRKPSQARRKPTSKPIPLHSSRTSQDTWKKSTKPDKQDSKTLRKYGSSTREKPSVDKENALADMSSPLSSALDSDELDSDFLLEEAPSKSFLSEELRLQALKFAEVDKWQMEFEDVIISGTQGNSTFR